MVRIHSGAPYVGDLSRRSRERFSYTEKEDVGMDVRSVPLVKVENEVLSMNFKFRSISITASRMLTVLICFRAAMDVFALKTNDIIAKAPASYRGFLSFMAMVFCRSREVMVTCRRCYFPYLSRGAAKKQTVCRVRVHYRMPRILSAWFWVCNFHRQAQNRLK